MLDEPTDNLDIDSEGEALEAALRGSRGPNWPFRMTERSERMDRFRLLRSDRVLLPYSTSRQRSSDVHAGRSGRADRSLANPLTTTGSSERDEAPPFPCEPTTTPHKLSQASTV
jgi:hypothetical protein